jgi:hypothetical protein
MELSLKYVIKNMIKGNENSWYRVGITGFLYPRFTMSNKKGAIKKGE